jgi:chemotaxis protein methyltransferase CheR
VRTSLAPASNSTAERAGALSRDTEFAFTEADFREIAELLRMECGISLGANKKNLVYSRLAKRLRSNGLSSFRDYCALISGDDGAEERHAMVAAMTTNVTRFFREQHHFDHLRTEVLPRLAKSLRARGRARIWSAGCSSGEEPYSIAMTVLAAIPDAAEFNIKILATDIDPNMIAFGKAAAYGVGIADSIPAEYLKTWCVRGESDGDKVYRIADRVRSLISFNELNLLGPWPMQGQFDVVFCRNVMIYFDGDTQAKLCRRFANLMPPGGVLYIGHSERLGEDELSFDLHGRTTYVKRGGAER